MLDCDGEWVGVGELASCRQTSTSYLINAGRICAASSSNSRHQLTIRNNFYSTTTMLRLNLFASARPFFGPVAHRPGLKVFPLRSFGSVGARPHILEIFRNRPPNVVTKPFQQSSRGIVDSAVISRPSQTEAWRRYAVTAVRWIARHCTSTEPTTEHIYRPRSPAPSLA